MIQDLSGSWCIKGTNKSTLAMDLLVPLIHIDPDRFWITDTDPDQPKGMHPKGMGAIKDLHCVVFENSFKIA